MIITHFSDIMPRRFTLTFFFQDFPASVMQTNRLVVNFGLSICSKKDQFSKRRGVELSMEPKRRFVSEIGIIEAPNSQPFLNPLVVPSSAMSAAHPTLIKNDPFFFLHAGIKEDMETGVWYVESQPFYDESELIDDKVCSSKIRRWELLKKYVSCYALMLYRDSLEIGKAHIFPIVHKQSEIETLKKDLLEIVLAYYTVHLGPEKFIINPRQKLPFSTGENSHDI